MADPSAALLAAEVRPAFFLALGMLQGMIDDGRESASSPEMQEADDCIVSARAALDALLARCEQAEEEARRLKDALCGAREAVIEWGAYASDYFVEKHDLAGDIAEIDAALKDAR